MSVSPDLSTLCEVRLIGCPVELYGRTAQHYEELKREFALIAGGETQADVPRRLLALSAQLRARFSTFTTAPSSALRAALERGDATVDLSYRVPTAVGPAAAEFERLLNEADEFCARGSLLTLATPDDLVAFRRWFLGEFTSQTAGEPPQRWMAANSRR